MDAMAKKRFDTGKGPSQRQLKVGELIRRTISDALLRGDLHDPDLARMYVSINEVRVTADLRIATVFALPLGGKDAEEAVKALSNHKHELRQLIAKTTGLKFTPDLRFKVDDTFDQMDETRRLFDNEVVQRDIAASKPSQDDSDEEE